MSKQEARELWATWKTTPVILRKAFEVAVIANVILIIANIFILVF